MLYDLNGKTIFVAGHGGMVGRALINRLNSESVAILTAARSVLDLRDRNAVFDWMASHRPHLVIVAAAKVGGIMANSSQPVQFLSDNLLIQTNLIDAAFANSIEKLLFLGSSCIYPKHSPQPIKEEYLLSGNLEETNKSYALAKIAGIQLCQAYRQQYGADFITAMPCNLYGPYDNFHVPAAHVLPGLIAKLQHAAATGQKEVVIWGTGSPKREFLYIDDLADACVHLLKHYSSSIPLNIGSGSDVSILELAELIAEVAGFKGRFVFDRDKPDGTPRKLLDISKLRETGWAAATSLKAGIAKTFDWYQTHYHQENMLRA